MKKKMDHLNNIPKRKRGRPKKGDLTPRLTKKWEPVNWKPEYEIIVLYSVTGKTNKEIGALTNFTKEQVWNILHTERAKALRLEYVERLKANIQGKFDGFVTKATELAQKRIIEVLDNDDLAMEKPLAVFDRAAALLKGTGKFTNTESRTEVNINNTNNVLNVSQVTQLESGASELRKLMERKNLLPSVIELDKSKEVVIVSSPAK